MKTTNETKSVEVSTTAAERISEYYRTTLLNNDAEQCGKIFRSYYAKWIKGETLSELDKNYMVLSLLSELGLSETFKKAAK